VNQDKGGNKGKHNIKRIVSWGGGIGTPLLIATLVIIFTPPGLQIRNYLFPPYAVVEGSIYLKDDTPAPKSKLVLDNETQPTWTDAAGNFYFEKVSIGTHSYWIYDTSDNLLVGPLTFFVTEGEPTKKLGIIELDNIQPSRFEQIVGESDIDTLPTPENPTEDRSSANMTANLTATDRGEDEISLMHEARFVRAPTIYNVTVWLNGPQETLSDIE
jgi:hypothetical protein